jgi:hypothetical protein
MTDEYSVDSVWSVPNTRLFISYSHKDSAYRDQLVAHLAGLERAGKIATWHDRKIMPGQDWSNVIDDNLDRADIILALASADFLASDYCASTELQQALARQSSGRSILVPVIVRPCSLSATPLAGLEALPEKARPVSEWDNRDRSWVNVVEGIVRILPRVQGPKERFLELYVPSILIKAYTRRADLMELELHVEFDSNGLLVHPRSDPIKCETVVRNIQRLRSKHSQIYQSIEAFRVTLQESFERTRTEVWGQYESLFQTRGFNEFFLKLAFQDRLEELLGVITKELKIHNQLSEANLQAPMFGLPSLTDTLADSSAVSSAVVENFSGVARGVQELSGVVAELKKIGKRTASDDFEDPETE